MLTETITVGDLVARTLDVLHRHNERPEPRAVSVTNPTTLTMSNALGVANGTLLETGYELLRTSNVAGTTLTVERRYGGTPSAGDAFTSVAKDPLWPRHQVLRAVSDALSNMHGQIPLLKSTEATVAEDLHYVDLSAVADLWVPKRVGFFTSNGAWVDLPQWEFVDNVASSVAPGVTRFITLPVGLLAGDKVVVTYRARYAAVAYATPNEAATVTVPLGGRDLPALAAAGRLLSNREVSRVEVDRVEEWTQAAAIQGGWTLRAVNQLWQEYYRRVDEVARSVQETAPKHRPYRKMQNPLFGRRGR